MISITNLYILPICSPDVSGGLVAEVAVCVVPVEVGEVAHLVEHRLRLLVHGALAQTAQVKGKAA